MVELSSAPPCATDSLVECALKVLQCPDPWQKAEYTYSTVRMWRDGTIKRVRPVEWRHLRAPDRPARSDDKVRVCAPGEAPRRGKGGSLASRQALLHSAVHIENWAVDLSWDVVARFGLRAHEYELPREFFDDFVTVAEDECRHFTALAKRLEEVGSHYGAFAVHDGLWESAAATAHSLPARLAVEHCVHEARGLDVLPGTVAKFANNGDAESAALLRDVIYPEEISHCAAGVRWIRYLYDVAHGRRPPAPPADADAQVEAEAEAEATPLPAASTNGAAAAAAAAGDADAPGGLSARLRELGVGTSSACGEEGAGGGGGDTTAAATSTASTSPLPPSATTGPAAAAPAAGGGAEEASAAWVADARRHVSVEAWFHSLVRAHFWGGLKPPFNDEARARAGFGPEWYLPLAQPAGGAPAAAAHPEAASGAPAAVEADTAAA
ncbi:hypothetical protein Agub_g1027 [Astrephomene gubernaculifera]|uniref:Uncharacterized protein n=1 Tax=Astrephomene gubernaculifera TaxID=47775 RepID=A0AAD3DEP5_9CHLO|nr:hypothetical protein Agub_g1027 [Astrephomene gubernaculifera]